RDEHVAAEGELAVARRRAVGDRLAGPDPLAQVDDRALVDARARVAAHELLEPVLVELALVGLDLDALGGDADHDAVALRDNDLAGVAAGPLLPARADDARL